MSASPDENHTSLSQTYRILRPDGSLRWVSAYTFLVWDESTDTFYQVCIAQDITGQNQVDETLRKALDRSREQFTLSRRMSLARKPEAVLKTLMSAAELRSAQRAFVLFFESHLLALSRYRGDCFLAIRSIPGSLPIRTIRSEKPACLKTCLYWIFFHPSRPVIVTRNLER